MPCGFASARVDASDADDVLALCREHLNRLQQVVDLLRRMRSGQLDTETDLVVWDERIGRHRDIDSVAPQQIGNKLHRVARCDWQFDDGRAGGVRRLHTERAQVIEHPSGMRVERVTQCVTPIGIQVEAGEDSHE